MARAWRIEYEGAYYHLLSRGNERRDIFRSDADRRMFLDTLSESCERFDFELFAYVLMPNHYHLLIRTRQANLSRAMQWFSGTYTRRFNNRHARSGHLFQGRFKSMLVQNDAYVLQLSCYIHRNPLRAGLVQRLADYPWSSYLAYAYSSRPPGGLSTQLILSHFDLPDPHRAYREKVQGYAQEERCLWEDFRHGFIMGSKQFAESVRNRFLPEQLDTELTQQRHLARDKELSGALKTAAQWLGCDLPHLISKRRVSRADKEMRDLLIYWLWKSGLFRNEHIGTLFGLTYSAVSHSVQGMKNKLQSDKNLRALFTALNSQFKV
jgi:REP element-mobilizing transposase RayT